MKVLGLIPARGGSKALPGKNIRLLAGKPLIQHAYESALASGALDRIILSTDSDEIAAVAREFGLEAPFMRPAETARDDSPMMDVVLHALKVLDGMGYQPDAVMVLQPTSPLRRPEHICKAVEMLDDHDAVCTVVPVPKAVNPYYVMTVKADGYLEFIFPESERIARRQDIPVVYRRDGTIFLTRTRVLLEQKTFYGRRCIPYALDRSEGLNIDTAEDWADAEQRMMARP